MECPICCSDAIAGDSVSCPYCHFETCAGCAEKFLVAELKEPNCMGCRKAWSKEFVLSNFRGEWLREWFVPHLGKLIMDREKSMLPDAQGEAALIAKIRSMNYKIQGLDSNEKIKRKYNTDPVVLEYNLAEKRRLKDGWLIEIEKLKSASVLHSGSSKHRDSDSVRAYILKCPCGDCRGFVDKYYVCGTCQSRVCDACHAPQGIGHVCKTEDVLSATLVAKETKPCPKCMAPIFKVNGCSQMFCTQCQTAFDWQTGRVETGILHNPHYYEWLAANAGESMQVEAVGCGELPHPQVFLHRLNKCTDSMPLKRDLIEMYRTIQHIQQAILPAYAEDRVKDNLDLRVAYLLGDIGEEVWAKKLANREKKRMRKRAYRELLEVEFALMSDFTRKIMYEGDKIASIAMQFRSLKNYHRETIEEISRIHGGCIPLEIELF